MATCLAILFWPLFVLYLSRQVAEKTQKDPGLGQNRMQDSLSLLCTQKLNVQNFGMSLQVFESGGEDHR